MDRVMGKLNHWDKMRETTYTKRASDQQLAEIKLQNKYNKIEKFGKAQEERLKDEVDRI